MSRSVAGALTVAALLTLGCSREPPPAAEQPARAAGPTPFSIESMPSPTLGFATEPYLSTSEKGPMLSWVSVRGDSAALMFSERMAGGWTSPKEAASGRDWFVNDSDVPTVMRLADGTLVAEWLKVTNARREAYDLLLSYSKDDGTTWTRPFTPHDDGTVTQHGFASIFEPPGGGVGVVWLDGREQVDTTSELPGWMSIRAATFDATWKKTSDKAIDRRVCECCPTSVATGSSGPLVAYRNLADESDLRNIHVSRLENGEWSPGQPVHDDKWVLDACPVNGPAVSASGSAAAVAWFTAPDDAGKAFAAFSSDGGRTWGSPIRLDDAASIGYVDIELLPDGSAAASWVEFADRRADLRVRRIEPSGMRSPAVTVSGSARPTGIPTMTRAGDQLVFAWVESVPHPDKVLERTPQVRMAVASVARPDGVR